MRLSAGEHSVSGLVLDANLKLARLEITGDSNAFISSNASTLLEVRAGAPPVMLRGLGLDGQVRVESSTEFAGCRFDGASVRRGRQLQAGKDVRALLVLSGHVVISDTVFKDLLGGAIEVSGGTLVVHTSTFTSNRAKRGGSVLVTGGKMTVGNSTFTDNKATDDKGGGAIRVGTSASLELADLTVITGSAGFGGSVASDVEWTYVLPAPLAHYVSNPEQNGIAQNGAGNYDFDYPIPCAATLHAASGTKREPVASFGPSLLGCLRSH